MFITALVNGTVCILTFKTKQSLTMGTGHYLLAASFSFILTMILFTLKFLFLMMSQMSIIQNRAFLLLNCICTDFLLRGSLAIGEWLNACVSIERALAVRLGIKFNKIRSKLIAKKVTFGLVFFILGSLIHDPLHRYLLDAVDEQRTWCITRYSASLKKYVSFINIFHFFIPFSVNFISIIFMITSMARMKSRVNPRQTYRSYVKEQFYQHKHQLIGSFLLLLISSPRLIISFASECMKSVRNPWLYLIGYLVSFILPLLTFVLFVLPSSFYRNELHESVLRIKKRFVCVFCREQM